MPSALINMSNSSTSSMTMSSIEIADLVDSRHDKVKQSIERLVKRHVIELPPLGEVRNHQGQRVLVYSMDKRSSLILVAQLSPEFTARVVDRWQELEAQIRQSAPLTIPTHAEALRLAADAVEQLEQAQRKIEKDSPKVEFADKYATASGTKTFRQVAKLLNANESRFKQFLLDERVYYYLNGDMTAYEQHIRAGRFVTRTGLAKNEKHTFTQTRFTPKGVVWITELWSKRNAEASKIGVINEH